MHRRRKLQGISAAASRKEAPPQQRSLLAELAAVGESGDMQKIHLPKKLWAI
jgi:hypothetical protein